MEEIIKQFFETASFDTKSFDPDDGEPEEFPTHDINTCDGCRASITGTGVKRLNEMLMEWVRRNCQ